MTATLEDPVAEAKRVMDWARERGVMMRVLGGVAVCLRAPNELPRLPRTVRDIDFVTPRHAGRRAAEVLEALGYEANRMFNAMHGPTRLLFSDANSGRHVDVFVGEFTMCHTIPIADRLDFHDFTVPLAELLLTKLQIVELTDRDQRDILSLCFHHEIAEGAPDGIEGEVVARVCADDWGLWRTCTLNLERTERSVNDYELPGDEQALISDRVAELRRALESEPKSRRWRLRSRIGERVRWYAEPEEEADIA